MHNQSYIYCFVALTPLNMFRALLCPLSGGPSNCLCSPWLPYDCRVGRASSCGRFTSLLVNRPQLEGAPNDGHNGYIYCFAALTPLNMFRAPLCPSSGADDGHNSARNMLSGVNATKQ
jgi:hypothetical protein